MIDTRKIHAMQDAIALLQDATNKVYNIEGQMWQLSYEVLEAIVSNLQIELSREETKQKEMSDA